MKRRSFGCELIMDLYGCRLDVIKSKKKLKDYVDKLCELIDMKKYGKLYTPYFGLSKKHTKGYSLLQFIETSSICGHFSEHWKISYLNIFSCKKFNYRKALKFSKEFFGAKKAYWKFIPR